MCACARASVCETQAKGCTRTKSWGLGIRGAHVEAPDLAVCLSHVCSRSRSVSVSLSLSHSHRHARPHFGTAPRPELVFQSPHTQRTAISP